MFSLRFNLRTLLAALSIAAVIAMLGAPGFGGRVAAVGLTAAALSVGFMLLTHAAFVAVATRLAATLGAEDIVARTSRGGIATSIDGGSAQLHREAPVSISTEDSA